MIATVRGRIGTMGCRVLFVLAIPIHLATIAVAFLWYGGWRGAAAALLSAVVPVFPELFWAVRVGLREGPWHWYVLLVAAYPIIWLAFLIGGLYFGPDEDA